MSGAGNWEQTEKMGWQEPHAVPQKEAQSPAPGRSNSRHQYMLGADQLEIREEHLGIAQDFLWGV